MVVKRKTQSPDASRSKTRKPSFANHDTFYIGNKHKDFDYGFVRREEVENGNAEDRGWEPITAANSSGETFAAKPWGKDQKTGASKRGKTIEDVVACKRPIEAKYYFDGMSNQKYNLYIDHIKSVAKRTNARYKKLEMDAGLTDEKSEFSGPGMQEREIIQGKTLDTDVQDPNLDSDLEQVLDI